MSGGGTLGWLGMGALGPGALLWNIKGQMEGKQPDSSPPTADTTPEQAPPAPKTRQQLIAEQYAQQRAAVYSQDTTKDTLGSKSLLGNA